MKQLNLITQKIDSEFGGNLLKGKRKDLRPFDSKKPTHLVLKATNALVLLKERKAIEQILKSYAKKIGLKIHDVAVNADHVHLIIQGKRILYQRWIRAVTSVLVLKFSGLKWKLRPYTRIAGWGKDYKRLKNYLQKNRDEAHLILYAEDRVRAFAARFHPPARDRPSLANDLAREHREGS